MFLFIWAFGGEGLQREREEFQHKPFFIDTIGNVNREEEVVAEEEEEVSPWHHLELLSRHLRFN